MAVYFAPQDRSGSAGIGASMGESLQKTLMMLTQNKMLQQQQQNAMQMQENQRQRRVAEVSQGLQQVLGVSPEEANSVAMLPPAQQKFVFERLFGTDEGEGPDQEEAGMQGLMGAGQEQPTQVADSDSRLDELFPEQKLPGQESLEMKQEQLKKLTTLPFSLPDKEAEVAGQEEIAEDSDQYKEMAAKVQEAVDKLPPEEKKALKAEIAAATKAQAATKRKTLRERIKTPRIGPKERAEILKEKMAEQKMSLSERKFQYTKQVAIDKETKEYFTKTSGKAKAAVENDWRLDKMSKLIETGNLASPKTAALIKAASIKGFGVDLTSLMGADAEEFSKLSSDFVKNVKEFIGSSRITQGEIEMFLKTVPNLLQSDEGKRRVIQNLKLFNKAAKVRSKAMKDIIKENGNERPKNLELMVEEQISPELDKIGEEFQKIIKSKEVVKVTSMYDDFKEAINPLNIPKKGLRIIGKALGTAAALPVYIIKELITGAVSGKD